MESRARKAWLWLNLIFQTIFRLVAVIAGFLIGRQWGLAVGLIAVVAVLAYVTPGLMIMAAAAVGSDQQSPMKLIQTAYRIQFVTAIALLVASIPFRLPGLIAFCAVFCLLAGLNYLMMWAARQTE